MLMLVSLAALTAPRPVAASCSGDVCGCDPAECLSTCPPVGDPNHNPCVTACNRASNHCAICCCCEDFCPHFCGG